MPGELRQDGRDPEQIGAYRILGRIAEGGQGVVYLAESPSGVQVALKLLRAAWLLEPSARERLVKEVAAARHVARFCTAQVIEADVDGEQPFIVSEYVEGRSLAEQVRTDGPVTGSALDRLAIGTATALVAIHQARIVHRDLKPSNVMLGPDGPRVIDFGIARDLVGDPTSTDRVMGTPTYMAPEQMKGGPVGPAADLWSWAATMVFAATGRPPFHAENVVALMYQVVNAEPRLDGVAGPLRVVVEQCLAKDPARRPGAEEVLFGLLGTMLPTRTWDGAAPVGDAVLAEASRHAAEPVTPVPATPPTSPVAPAPAAPVVPDPGVPAQGVPAPAGGMPLGGSVAAQRGRRPVGPLIGIVLAAAVLLAGGGLAVRALFGWPGSPGGGTASAAGVASGSAVTRTASTATGSASGVATAGASATSPTSPTSPTSVGSGAAVTGSPAAEASPAGGPTGTRTATARPGSTRPATTPSANPAATTARPPAPATQPPAPQGLTVPVGFAGTWTGTATQHGGSVDSFQLRITLARGAGTGSYELLDVGCAGTVTVVNPLPTSSVLHLHQELATSGGIPCANGGAIRLTALSGNALGFSWVDDESAANTAGGTLNRVA